MITLCLKFVNVRRVSKTLFVGAVFLTFFLAWMSAFGQSTGDKKSVYKDFKGRSSSTSINMRLGEAEEVRERDPQQALEKVKEALAMSITQKNAVAEGRCYNLLGEINLSIQEYKLALENYNTAMGKLGASGKSGYEEYIRSINGMGVAHLRLGNYDEALKYFDLLMSPKEFGPPSTAVLLNVSEVYYEKGNYTRALEVLERTAKKKVLSESEDLQVENQKVRIYARLKQVDKANALLNTNVARSKSSVSGSVPRKEETAIIQSAKEEVSDALYEQERYDDEIALRENSIGYNLDVKNLSEVSKDKVELSKAYVAKGETSEAIRELHEAAYIADTIGDPGRQAEAYLSLAELYQRHGDPRSAIENYRKFSQAVTKKEAVNEQKLLEKSNLIKTQRDIEELSKYVAVQKQQEELALAMVFRQRLIIYGLLFIIGIVGITSYFIYKNAVASKTANQLLALKSLRSQMNPHFIFNALNSVNQFVLQNDERATNKFISEFSRLMRLVLENSQEDFIPLFKEEEIISLYLKLEHYRFRDKFDYSISMDEDINKETIEIPPMLIQPYIENAVWHGLRYKETKGFLSVNFTMEGDNLVVEILDNGIGRRRSAELKTENQKKHESTGLKNIRERLGIINKVYKSNFKVHIEDLEADAGTRVKLYVPVQHKIRKHA